MAVGALLLRRDANRRRAGTGRQTTKRAFTISLPAPGLFLARGAATATLAEATPGRGLKRPTEIRQDEASPVEEAAVPQSGAGALSAAPNSEAAFRRANKLLRTPAAGAVPTEERDDAASNEPDEAAAVAPVMRIPFGDEAGPSSGGSAASEAAPAEEQEEALHNAMGSSPVHFAGDGVTDEEALRRSMGTSPMGPHEGEAALVTLATQTSGVFEASSEPEIEEPIVLEQAAEASPAARDDDDDEPAGFDEQPDWDDDIGAAGGDPDVHEAAAEAVEATQRPPIADAPVTAKPPKKKRKTSLDRLGRNPGTEVAIPTDVQTEPALLPGGHGRSKRQRFRPLEFWRNERKVYGRRDSGKFESVVDILVAEREPTPPHFRRMQRNNARKGKKDQTSMALVLADDAADPLAGAVDALADDDAGAVIADAAAAEARATGDSLKRKKMKAAKAGGGYARTTVSKA